MKNNLKRKRKKVYMYPENNICEKQQQRKTETKGGKKPEKNRPHSSGVRAAPRLASGSSY